MNIFCYDKTFEGLLTCVFDAYSLKTFPDMLVAEEDTLPLFYDSIHTVTSDQVKADRVWTGLGRRISEEAREQISECWMADGTPHVDELIFRYIRKAIDGLTNNTTAAPSRKAATSAALSQSTPSQRAATPSTLSQGIPSHHTYASSVQFHTAEKSSVNEFAEGTKPSGSPILPYTPRKTAPTSIEVNFTDPDVLALSRVFKQVHYEVQRMKMFVRFQKAADGTYFAPFEPLHDVLPMAIEHFRDRFGDQKWIIYDVKRGYGFHFDLHTVQEVTFTDEAKFLKTGLLDEAHLDPDELLLQNMWKAYFKSICIKERLNPRKHRQDMPVRYWKHLTEKR